MAEGHEGHEGLLDMGWNLDAGDAGLLISTNTHGTRRASVAGAMHPHIVHAHGGDVLGTGESGC